MDVNYLIEINGLNDWEFGNPLSATAYKVMCKLLFLANRQRFPEQIKVSNTSLCALVGCTENSLLAARQQLIQRGLIDYKGKKKQTPVYSIHYFSHNPAYNRKICGVSEGISGGNDGGMDRGNDGGIGGGRYINKGVGCRDGSEEEEDYDDDPHDYTAAEVQHDDNSSLRHPSPTQPNVDIPSGARAKPLRDRAFPARKGVLSLDETYALIAAKQALEMPVIQKLYGDNLRLMHEIAESDYFPLELVAYAIRKTQDRNRMWHLDNPAAYTVKLLDDWKEQGFKTQEEVQEAKDDYYHYG